MSAFEDILILMKLVVEGVGDSEGGRRMDKRGVMNRCLR